MEHVKTEKMKTAVDNLKKNRAFLCLECGKCTSVCPISTHNESFSPRKMIAEGLFYGTDGLINDRLLWSCLTCQLCSQRCPADVKFSELMRDYRAEAYSAGMWGSPSHGGVLHYIMEMGASPGLQQKRTEWIDKKLKVKEKGEILYFVGCLPYYQDLFAKDFDFSPTSIAVDTVKILNYLNIEPVVMNNERCCGHDLYWLGQLEKFDELAKLNLDMIAESGAKTVVTACPECALSLKQLYQERIGGVRFEVKHITELVHENIDKFKFKNLDTIAAFQDPCRLGRYMGVYDQPRESIKAVPGVKLREMAHNRRGAICCGTTNWMNCDTTSKKIQQSRIEEASDTGAGTLITSCPKCQIHFRCTTKDAAEETADKSNMKFTDFVNFIASALTE
jgi:heterodisulfide reductase subunit D